MYHIISRHVYDIPIFNKLYDSLVTYNAMFCVLQMHPVISELKNKLKPKFIHQCKHIKWKIFSYFHILSNSQYIAYSKIIHYMEIYLMWRKQNFSHIHDNNRLTEILYANRVLTKICVPFVVITISSCPHPWLITRFVIRVTLRVILVELLTQNTWDNPAVCVIRGTQYIYGGFFPGIPVSSINKTDRSDINKISLKVALNTINLQTYLRFTVSPWPFSAFSGSPCETCIYTTSFKCRFVLNTFYLLIYEQDRTADTWRF